MEDNQDRRFGQGGVVYGRVRKGIYVAMSPTTENKRNEEQGRFKKIGD